MEEVMLHRLSIITKQIEQATAQALAHLPDLKIIEEAEITLKKLETAINRFTTELHNYFRLSVEPAADDISSFSEIQLKGEETLSELKVRLDRRKKQNFEETCNNTSQSHVAVQSCKLPKLDLCQYDGSILNWHQFYDQYQSNIGCRNLTDVDKLLYLKSSLTGNAKAAIEGLEVTNKNYTIAINTLKQRFGKENQIIDAHYSALYRIKSAEKTSEDARRTLNEVERHLRVLNSLGEDINHNHVRFLIMEKFPEDIIYEMKMMIKTDSIDEMRNTLETIISAREDASRIVLENSKNETYTTESLHVKEIAQSHTYQQSFNKAQTSWNDRNSRPQNSNENRRHDDTRRTDKFSGARSTFNRYPMKRTQERPTWNNKGGQDRKRTKLHCIFCEGDHFNELCQIVRTINDRKAKLQGRCFSCFSTNHTTRECPRKIFCVHCQQADSHNRSLCPKICLASKESTSSFHTQSNSSTVLQTAVVNAKGSRNSNDVKCRVLLDSGSQRTYVTRDLAKKLNLPVQEECLLSVFTFASNKLQEFNSAIVTLNIQTRTNEIVTLVANVVPTISEGIAYPEEPLGKWQERAILADDGSLSSRIDILIGNDYYFSLILTGKVKLDDNLFLVETKLGWVLSGKLLTTRPLNDLSACTYFHSAQTKLVEPDLPLNNGNIKCLWELESIGICDSPKANRDQDAVNKFNDTTEVINGRYTVSWPWHEYPPNLSTNFGLAFGRLVNLLKRLSLDNIHSYNETLQEQLRHGIIEEAPHDLPESHPIHYLPHHGVCAPGKPTRIVYDASAKTKDSKSLNECLHCGPMMLENLTGIFLRFRSHKIGVTADVEKAFLQVGLHEMDKDVTRFLWLKDINKPATKENLLHLRFCRVPFGVISSPFLLNATIRHHLMQQSEGMLKKMASNIYVDNLVTGTETEQQAMTLYDKTKDTFLKISMNIRAWTSNSKEIRDYIPKEDTCEDTNVKILGLNWNIQNDTIQLRCKAFENTNTKRGVLRIIASVYDPCGYAVVHLLPAKLFLQDLWKQKQLKWDTLLPSDLGKKWSTVVKDLENILLSVCRDVTLKIVTIATSSYTALWILQYKHILQLYI